jgi:hypothetical protein
MLVAAYINVFVGSVVTLGFLWGMLSRSKD